MRRHRILSLFFVVLFFQHKINTRQMSDGELYCVDLFFNHHALALDLRTSSSLAVF